jgi:hypothetical protein
MASNKEMQRIARLAGKSGFTVARTRAGHYKISAKDGETIVIPFSPGTDASERDGKQRWNKFRKAHPHG